MQIKRIGVVATTMVIMTAAYLLLGSCDSNPTGPKPEEELKDYRVWFFDVGEVGRVKVYAYHPTTHCIDTFGIDPGVKGVMTASADGSLLYFCGGIGGETHVRETDSLNLVTILPYGLVSAVSLDGEYVCAHGSDGLRILRTTDYSVVYHDTILTRHAWFSADSRTLTAVSDYILQVTFTDTDTAVERRSSDLFDPRVVMQIVPTPDGTKWLIYATYPAFWTYVFHVYDVALDSIVFSELQSPGGGTISITPDGRYAFYGNPGTMSPGPPRDTSFTVFDIEANAIDRVVPIQRRINGIEIEYPYLVGDMVVTPDGRWLVMNDKGPGIVLYDIENREWADFHFFGWNNVYLTQLTVQTAL